MKIFGINFDYFWKFFRFKNKQRERKKLGKKFLFIFLLFFFFLMSELIPLDEAAYFRVYIIFVFIFCSN